jgi:hypothetical protein
MGWKAGSIASGSEEGVSVAFGFLREGFFGASFFAVGLFAPFLGFCMSGV